MSTELKDRFTEIVDITLYKYNSIDLKLWGIMSRDSGVRKVGDDALLIHAKKLNSFLLKYFRADINRFQSVSDVTIHKEATSIYFLYQSLQTMPNLTWIKCNLNKNSSYNRIVNVDQIKTIKYSIKILRGSLRLFDIFNEYEMELANKILAKCGLLEEDEHYVVIKVKKFLNILDVYLSENNTAELFTILNVMIHTLEPYEPDDPEMYLITDRKSDI